MKNTAFASVVPDTGRLTEKPRRSGLTMMMDTGIPLDALDDWFSMIAPHVDIVKFVTGTASIYETEYLQKKLSLFSRHGLDSFIGGVFLERVYEADGLPGAERFFAEARRLGITSIEVSDGVVPIPWEHRLSLVKSAIDNGLEVHGEVGSKLEQSGIDRLVKECQGFLAAGAELVVVEAAELMSNGIANEELCAEIRSAIDLDKVIFELCGPWIPQTHGWETYSVMRFLIKTFGPNVNLGNTTPELIFELEATRRGLNE